MNTDALHKWSEAHVWLHPCQDGAYLMQVRNNVPYQIIGGTPFWDRKEVKDLMAYIKLAVNPEDEVSLMRAINQPTRGVGAESQAKMKAWAEGQGLSLGQALFPHYQVSQPDFLTRGAARSDVGCYMIITVCGVEGGRGDALQHNAESSCGSECVR